uniref:Uncharacterized protein n=1 Tax=Arundo donax TaxID=35708 RepID=A0A0A9DIP4_ARUDO
MSRSTDPARMPPRSDEASDMAASASTPPPAPPHPRRASHPETHSHDRPEDLAASATTTGRRGAARGNGGLAHRRPGKRGSRQLAVRRAQGASRLLGGSDRSGAAAEEVEGFGSAGRREIATRREESGEREERER